jgi:hypothetical protein
MYIYIYVDIYIIYTRSGMISAPLPRLPGSPGRVYRMYIECIHISNMRDIKSYS